MLSLSLVMNSTVVLAMELSEVEIDADQLSTNFVTSESRLEGNVILRHQGMVLRCGLAEIFPKSETKRCHSDLAKHKVRKKANHIF